MEQTKAEFIELYIELLKVRKDETFNNHIYIDRDYDGDRVYCGAEVVNDYIFNGAYPTEGYISFKIGGLETSDLDYTNTSHPRILQKMRDTLEAWRVNEQE